MRSAGVKGRCRIAFAWPALVLTLIAADQSAGAVDRLDELRGQKLAMDPYPDIAEDQGDGDEQES